MKRVILLLTVSVLFLGVAGTASASVLTLNLQYEFSGATPPGGGTPWLRATFDDGGTAGSVQLTMEAVNLIDQEWVQEWYFNFDPVFNVSQLTFAYNAAASNVPGATNINVGVDAYQADGDGRFDIEFVFPRAQADRFTVGEKQVYHITSAEAITAYSFDFLSAPGGGASSQRSAAHVGGIGPDGNLSGWVGDVPEPSSLVLLVGAGLVAVGAGLRRRSF